MTVTPEHTDVTALYGFGSNGAGQLGVGHQDDLDLPQKCLFTRPIDAVSDSDRLSTRHVLHDSIKCVVAGGNHTLVLTGLGNVYAAGSNEDGKCGIEGGKLILPTFTYVSWAQGRNITLIAATWEASLFVEDDHLVWTCGRGSRGELGLGVNDLQSLLPRLAFDSHQFGRGKLNILVMSASMGHVVVVLSDGTTIGWGTCRKGQLGEEFKASKVLWKPERLHIPRSISKAVCGRDFTLFVGFDQRTMLVGDLKSDNDLSQIGLIEAGSKPYAGWSTVYMLHRGLISGFGQGRRGQLPASDMPCVVRLAAGSEHCIALSNDGKLLAWGWGEHGNCSAPLDERKCVADRFNVVSVPLAKGMEITGVGAGCASSFLWTANGE